MRGKFSRVFFIVFFGMILSLSPIISQNAFAASPITSAVANDPDDGDTIFSVGDTILITFPGATNATNGGTMTSTEFLANFTTTNPNPFDGTFSGTWQNSAQELLLTWTAIATNLVISSTTIGYDTDGNIGYAGNNTEFLTTAVTLSGDFGVVTSSDDSSGSGSGCNGDCEEPTLGVDSNNIRQVTNGFSYNGYAVDVERYFTPYPLITAEVGKTNVAAFKIYENLGPQNIRHFTFAFGMDKGDIISNSKAKIELDIDFDGTKTVTVTDPENALDNIKVITDVVTCKEDSNTKCLGVEIQHRFRAPLDFNIVGTDVWDTKRSSWQNYYNHGIEVVGESLNPPKEFNGIDRGHVYHLITTSKTTAVDEFGDLWTFQYGKWTKDFIKQERIQDGDTLVFDRMHSDFTEYKERLANDAFNQLIETCPLCIEQYADFDDSTSWEYGSKNSKLSDPEIQMLMSVEEQKAQQIMKRLLDVKYDLRNAYLGIDENRSIAEILEQERINKVILQSERDWLKQVVAPNQ